MAVDISKVDYSLVLQTPDNREITVDELLLSVSSEENDGELATRLRIKMRNIKRSDGWIHQHVHLARKLILKATDGRGWKEVFRGSVYRWKPIATDQTIEVVVYDMLYPMQQSKEHWYFSNGETGASSIRKMASKWGIPLGKVTGPNVGLSKKPYANNTMGDIIADRLKESREKGAGRFVVRSHQGKLECIQEGANTTVYQLDDNYIESSSEEHSIENLVTRVKVYGIENNEGRATLRATRDGSTKYGIIQEVIYSDAFDSLSEARKAADEILKEDGRPKIERPITGPDVPWVRKGDRIEVASGTIKSSNYIVESVTRNITEKRMTIHLKG